MTLKHWILRVLLLLKPAACPLFSAGKVPQAVSGRHAHTVSCINAWTHWPSRVYLDLNFFSSFSFLHCDAAVECTDMLDSCVVIHSVGAVGGQEEWTRLCLQVRRWGRLVLNRDGYWHSINMNKNIFFYVKGALPDVWMQPIQTHQHSITQSFHTVVRGARHKVMWEAEGRILWPWLSPSLKFESQIV